MSDRQEASRAGFEIFYQTELPRLLGALRLMAGAGAVAEDLGQEAMLRALRSWDRVAVMENPTAWLHQVGVNLVRRQRRARRVVPERAAPADWVGTVGDRAELVAALGRLPIDQRTAVVVRHVLGYSTAEAAVVLGRSPEAVRALLHRGVRSMRAEMEERR